jgi:hypothetical protein
MPENSDQSFLINEKGERRSDFVIVGMFAYKLALLAVGQEPGISGPLVAYPEIETIINEVKEFSRCPEMTFECERGQYPDDVNLSNLAGEIVVYCLGSDWVDRQDVINLVSNRLLQEAQKLNVSTDVHPTSENPTLMDVVLESGGILGIITNR